MDFDLVEAARRAPLAVRGLVGLAAVGLTLDGVRAYRVSLTLASFGIGAMGAVAAAQLASVTWSLTVTPLWLVLGAAVSGVLVALLARVAEAIALVLVGGLCGVQLVIAGGEALALDLPWYAAAIGGLVGGVLLPRSFPALLKVLTPAVGGVLAAWALGRPDDLVLIGVVWLCGALVQSRRSESRDDKRE